MAPDDPNPDPAGPAVSFQLPPDDYDTFMAYCHRHTAAGRRRRYRLYAAGALVFCAYCGVLYHDERYGGQGRAYYALAILLSFAVLAPLYVIAIRLVRGVLARGAVQYGPKRKLLEPAALALDAEGVQLETAEGRARIRWNGITAVDRAEEHLYLMTGPFAGFIVPLRSFASEEAARRFCTYAQARVNRLHDRQTDR